MLLLLDCSDAFADMQKSASAAAEMTTTWIAASSASLQSDFFRFQYDGAQLEKDHSDQIFLFPLNELRNADEWIHLD